MKIEEVVRHLYLYLPDHSTLFTDSITVTNLSRSGSTVTGQTAAAHNLSTNQLIRIGGALIPNQIVSLTQTGGIASAECADDTDLTEGYTETVIISGANEADYNGTFTLLSVDTVNKFTFAINPAAPATATGAAILLHENRLINTYNGNHTVSSTPTANSFTYNLAANLNPYTPVSNTGIDIITNFRISGAANETRISEYIANSKNLSDPWLFVIFDPSTSSKDRNDFSDANNQKSKTVEYRQLIIQPFKILVFTPANTSITARENYDDMIDLRAALVHTLVGFIPDSEFSETGRFKVTFQGDGIFGYAGSYYIHEFNFESVFYINEIDIYQDDITVAMRHIGEFPSDTFDFYMQFDDYDEIKKKMEIFLPEE